MSGRFYLRIGLIFALAPRQRPNQPSSRAPGQTVPMVCSVVCPPGEVPVYEQTCRKG